MFSFQIFPVFSFKVLFSLCPLFKILSFLLVLSNLILMYLRVIFSRFLVFRAHWLLRFMCLYVAIQLPQGDEWFHIHITSAASCFHICMRNTWTLKKKSWMRLTLWQIVSCRSGAEDSALSFKDVFSSFVTLWKVGWSPSYWI